MQGRPHVAERAKDLVPYRLLVQPTTMRGGTSSLKGIHMNDTERIAAVDTQAGEDESRTGKWRGHIDDFGVQAMGEIRVAAPDARSTVRG